MLTKAVCKPRAVDLSCKFHPRYLFKKEQQEGGKLKDQFPSRISFNSLLQNDCAPHPQSASGPCGVIRHTTAKRLVSKIKRCSHLALFSCKLMIAIRRRSQKIPFQPSLLQMWCDLESNILIPFMIAILSRRIIGFEFCVGELVRARDLQCLNLATDAIKDFVTQLLKVAASVPCTGLQTCRHLPNKSKPFPLVRKVNSTDDLWTGSQYTAQMTFEQQYSFLTSPSLLPICNVP